MGIITPSQRVRSPRILGPRDDVLIKINPLKQVFLTNGKVQAGQPSSYNEQERDASLSSFPLTPGSPILADEAPDLGGRV
jgi:hypothetical protein